MVKRARIICAPPPGFIRTSHDFGAFLVCKRCCQAWQLTRSMVKGGELLPEWRELLAAHRKTHAKHGRYRYDVGDDRSGAGQAR